MSYRRDDDTRKSLAGLLCRIAQGWRNWKWRGKCPVFSAQKRNELVNLARRDSFAKGWHLLTTVRDLIPNLIRAQALSYRLQGRPLFGAHAGRAVAIGASLVAKENGSGLLRFVGRKALCRVNRVAEKDS